MTIELVHEPSADRPYILRGRLPGGRIVQESFASREAADAARREFAAAVRMVFAR